MRISKKTMTKTIKIFCFILWNLEKINKKRIKHFFKIQILYNEIFEWLVTKNTIKWVEFLIWKSSIKFKLNFNRVKTSNKQNHKNVRIRIWLWWIRLWWLWLWWLFLLNLTNHRILVRTCLSCMQHVLFLK